MLKDILSYTKDPFFTLAIFGSYAKGTQKQNSDLDLLLIIPTKKESLKFQAAIEKTYLKIKKDIVIVSTEECREMLKKSAELNVGNETKKHHIFLHGAEQWYSILKEIENE